MKKGDKVFVIRFDEDIVEGIVIKKDETALKIALYANTLLGKVCFSSAFHREKEEDVFITLGRAKKELKKRLLKEQIDKNIKIEGLLKKLENL